MPTYDSSYDNSPITRVALTDSSGQPAASSATVTPADSQAAGAGQLVTSQNMVYNGLWQRMRGDDGGVYVQGTIDHDTADGGRPLKIGGKARTSVPSAVADADRVDAYFDENGRQVVKEGFAPVAEDNTNGVIGIIKKPVIASTYSGTAFAAFASSSVAISAKATPGLLRCIHATNVNGALRYLQIHNKATAPSSGNVPVFSFPIPAGSGTNPGVIMIDEDWLQNYYFTTGVAIGISTAAGSYTAATDADHMVNGQVF